MTDKWMMALRCLPIAITAFGATGCFYLALVKMPISTQIVDAETGQPIAGARLLQVVCDVHDFDCVHGEIDLVQSNQDGLVEVNGKHKWGLWFPAPGGLPSPNHQIAVWKDGYYTFLFSQYSDFESLQKRLTEKRQDLAQMMSMVPTPRKQYSPDQLERMLSDGQIELHHLDNMQTP
ncbi:hypothetical protein [Methylomagnum sp.]